jgi:hypothetical protein
MWRTPWSLSDRSSAADGSGGAAAFASSNAPVPSHAVTNPFFSAAAEERHVFCASVRQARPLTEYGVLDESQAIGVLSQLVGLLHGVTAWQSQLLPENLALRGNAVVLRLPRFSGDVSDAPPRPPNATAFRPPELADDASAGQQMSVAACEAAHVWTLCAPSHPIYPTRRSAAATARHARALAALAHGTRLRPWRV